MYSKGIEELRKKVINNLLGYPKTCRPGYVPKIKEIIKKYSEIINKRLGFRVKKKLETPTAEDLYLAEISQGSYETYYYFRSGGYGHAVLVKKNLDGSLALYDPNYGAVFNLTEEELCEVMAESFYAYVTPNIPVIIALAVVAILIISGIVTAVHGYNTIATISLITCLVGLSA